MTINGAVAKPAREVKPGDKLELRIGPTKRLIDVHALGERRGPASEAALLYTESEDSIKARSEADRAAAAHPSPFRRRRRAADQARPSSARPRARPLEQPEDRCGRAGGEHHDEERRPPPHQHAGDQHCGSARPTPVARRRPASASRSALRAPGRPAARAPNVRRPPRPPGSRARRRRPSARTRRRTGRARPPSSPSCRQRDHSRSGSGHDRHPCWGEQQEHERDDDTGDRGRRGARASELRRQQRDEDGRKERVEAEVTRVDATAGQSADERPGVPEDEHGCAREQERPAGRPPRPARGPWQSSRRSRGVRRPAGVAGPTAG